MKLIKTTMVKGKARHTVEVEPGEKLVAIREDDFYRLGEPMDEVLQGHIVAEARRVTWCPINQNWVDA